MIQRGSGPKPTRVHDELEVKYSELQWKLLARMREKASQIMQGLGFWKSSAFVHGSLARGDVDEKSDIDIVIPQCVNTQDIEASLGLARLSLTSRKITQATPLHSPKARMVLDLEERITVTVPLSSLRTLEEQFYVYGGIALLAELQTGKRKRGCTKKLTLIEPTGSGHREWSIIGREMEAASVLGVKSDLVRERVRVLTRRDKVGRTGIFLSREIDPNISFEDALQTELKNNPALRRTLRARQ